MKYFKVQALRTALRYDITRESFEEATGNKFPYESRDSDGRISQFGVCPSCLTPIQLIGLVREIKVSSYGKHTGKAIEGVARWNQIKYEYCPYLSNNN